MSDKYKIFYVTPEVTPFVKTGILSEISGGLPKALKELGHEIRVMMPNYKRINARRYVLRDVIRLRDMGVDLLGKKVNVSAKSAFLPNSKVQIYFLDNKEYFARDGMFVDPKTNKDYADNDVRFNLFCKGCLETLRMLHWQPDIFHCSGWQSAFFVVCLKAILADDPFLSGIRVTFSLDTLTAEMLTRTMKLENAELTAETLKCDQALNDDGSFSLIEAAFHHADLVFIGDEQENKELLESPEKIKGGQALLGRYRDKIGGLNRAIDDTIWTSNTNKEINNQYNIDNIEKKAGNKKDLLSRLELSYDEKTPLLGIVVPENKLDGFELFLQSFIDILDLGVQIAAFGVSGGYYDAKLKMISERFPRQFSYQSKLNESILHQLFAGADIFINPALEEPFGENHLFSLRYGTIPVVSIPCGNFSNMVDFEENPESGSSYFYDHSDESGLLSSLTNATQLFKETGSWRTLMKNAILEDHSWHLVAPGLVEKYHKTFSM